MEMKMEQDKSFETTLQEYKHYKELLDIKTFKFEQVVSEKYGNALFNIDWYNKIITIIKYSDGVDRYTSEHSLTLPWITFKINFISKGNVRWSLSEYESILTDLFEGLNKYS
jgi:hypothetical protein